MLERHPSVNGTPTKDSLRVRLSKELANLRTALSRGSNSRGCLFSIGSSSHLKNKCELRVSYKFVQLTLQIVHTPPRVQS